MTTTAVRNRTRQANPPATVVGRDGKHYPARRTRGTGKAVRRPSRPTGRSPLAQLQRYWQIATQEDRAAFMNWIHAEDLIANYALEVAARLDNSAHATDADHSAGEDPEARDDGPHPGRDEQDEAEG